MLNHSLVEGRVTLPATLVTQTGASLRNGSASLPRREHRSPAGLETRRRRGRPPHIDTDRLKPVQGC
jgi:hypothetical protein